MIDRTPLDLFGAEPDETSVPAAAEQPSRGTRVCAWCQEPVADDANTCPACGSLLPGDRSPTLPGQALAVEPEPAASAPPVVQGAVCQWCGEPVADTDEVCAACNGRLRPVDEMAGALYGSEPILAPDPNVCQWCSAVVAPEDEFCPACGGVARGDTTLELPGITVPLTEEQLAARVRSEMAQGHDDEAETAIRFAAEVLVRILPWT